jgi:hypothetical protein
MRDSWGVLRQAAALSGFRGGYVTKHVTKTGSGYLGDPPREGVRPAGLAAKDLLLRVLRRWLIHEEHLIHSRGPDTHKP